MWVQLATKEKEKEGEKKVYICTENSY